MIRKVAFYPDNTQIQYNKYKTMYIKTIWKRKNKICSKNDLPAYNEILYFNSKYIPSASIKFKFIWRKNNKKYRRDNLASYLYKQIISKNYRIDSNTYKIQCPEVSYNWTFDFTYGNLKFRYNGYPYIELSFDSKILHKYKFIRGICIKKIKDQMLK